MSQVTQALSKYNKRTLRTAIQCWQASVRRRYWKLAATTAADSYCRSRCRQLALQAWLTAVLFQRRKLRQANSAIWHR